MYRGLARKPDEKNHCEDLNVDGRVISEIRMEWDWIYLAQDREHLQVLLNMVMDLTVPGNAGNFLMSLSQEGLSSMYFLSKIVYVYSYI
jgi:hypothetical protein